MDYIIDKKDIHSGYLVVFRNGETGLIQRVGDRFRKIVLMRRNGRTTWQFLSNWNVNLHLYNVADSDNEMDIMKVYSLVCDPEDSELCTSMTVCGRELLWERKEAKKMTMQEVCEALGYEVEIVK